MCVDVQACLNKPDTFELESGIDRTLSGQMTPTRQLKLRSYTPESAISRTLFLLLACPVYQDTSFDSQVVLGVANVHVDAVLL